MDAWRSQDAVCILSFIDVSLFQCHPAGYKVLTGMDHEVSLTIFQTVVECFLENMEANLKIKAQNKYMGSKHRGRTALE